MAEEGHRWAKYNLGWAGRRALSLAPALVKLPVPAFGCDPCCPGLRRGAGRPGEPPFHLHYLLQVSGSPTSHSGCYVMSGTQFFRSGFKS